MFILDTNVISELRKAKTGKANEHVIAWAKTVSPNSLYISVITILELEAGILRVERRDSAQGAILRSWLTSHVLPAFSERILDIDTAVAIKCAKLHIPNPQSDRDALIAATGLVHGLPIVTRNIKDFEGSGVQLLNPWDKAE